MENTRSFEFSQEPTSVGSTMSWYLPARTTDKKVVGTYTCDAPITTGRRVPKKLRASVFVPATNNKLRKTIAFSFYLKES